MCGRYALYGPKSRSRPEALAFYDEEIDFTPHYNAAPTQQLPVYAIAADGRRGLTLMRWGLVPAWAKDPAIGARMINARSETVAEKPSFRAAYRRRRCLVPMNGFYEWQKTPAHKVPHFIRLLNDEVFAAAGLYEQWPGNTDTGPLTTFTILTTAANALIRPLHERMPVIVAPAAYETWLDPGNVTGHGLDELLRPYPEDEMRAVPVSTRVNSVRNDDAALLDPVGA